MPRGRDSQEHLIVTDILGRSNVWQRVHVIDASRFWRIPVAARASAFSRDHWQFRKRLFARHTPADANMPVKSEEWSERSKQPFDTSEEWD